MNNILIKVDSEKKTSIFYCKFLRQILQSVQWPKYCLFVCSMFDDFKDFKSMYVFLQIIKLFHKVIQMLVNIFCFLFNIFKQLLFLILHKIWQQNDTGINHLWFSINSFTFNIWFVVNCNHSVITIFTQSTVFCVLSYFEIIEYDCLVYFLDVTCTVALRTYAFQTLLLIT